MDFSKSNTCNHQYLDVPFSKRWDCHRDTIQRMYIHEGRSIEDIASKMKKDYSFDANARQYKYQFKKWKLNKNVLSTTKDQVIKVLEKRVRMGKAIGEVRYDNKPLDKKKLKRYLQTIPQVESRLSRDAIIFARSGLPQRPDATQDEIFSGRSTPVISVISPPQTPTRSGLVSARTPTDALTPTAVAIGDLILRRSRAASLLNGRFGDLLDSMSGEEQRISTAWLDQFRYFSFKTFKYWGKGPRIWTADMLQFGDPLDRASLDKALDSNANADFHGSSSERNTPNDGQGVTKPTDLCRWSIHRSIDNFPHTSQPLPSTKVMPATEPLPLHTTPQSLTMEVTEQYDIDDPDSWSPWPKESPPANPIIHLQQALHTNVFSNIKANILPIPSIQVAKAAAQSRDELVVESVGFAIMTRNITLLRDLLRRNALSDDFRLEKLNPFHLAATYLDGAMSCCSIMETLIQGTTAHNRINTLFTDNLGHTVLDSLMITILKAHSTCLPEVVDDEFKGLRQFVGEEIDPCGRWDADSPCTRESRRSSRDPIPQAWKHMFCHTSVQAICHIITSIYTCPGAPRIETRSGLFVRSCGRCGIRLELLPLHTLVLTTYYLAENSCEGETLFGALACLVCLLVHGADASMRAEISVQALLENGDGEMCTHEALDPLQLARRVSRSILTSWRKELQVGWDVLLAVLQLAQQQKPEEEELGQNSELDEDPGQKEDPELDEDLYLDESTHELGQCYHYEEVKPHRPTGALWASIQAEYLTYRRLDEEDPWISDNFIMTTIIDDLEYDRTFPSLPLNKYQMMKPHCICGRFYNEDADDYYEDFPTIKEACEFDFSNLKAPNRSTYLTV
ncbi:hypothetical protein PG988_000034 [Apiospora saccharicola]